ncbi:hypothetical protein HRR78_000914 [Exophiala dermatitidis]|nr:hypothetical protein HRR78_000914 [Exophiala dermatitidis]
MGVVFLVYYNAAGGEVLAALPVESGRGTFYLPNQPAGTAIDLALELDPQHSSLCLVPEVDPGCVLLRVFDETDGSCSVLNDDGSEFEIPLSSSLHHKSLIIRGDEHFLSPAGRWAVRWDDEQGTVWNSMRPPSLPLVTLDQEASPEEEHLKEILQGGGYLFCDQPYPCADLTSAGPPSKVQSPSPKSSQHSTGPVQELTSNADDRLTNGSQDDSVRIEAHEVGTAALSAAEILDLQDSNVDTSLHASEMPTTERKMVEGRATEEASHQGVEIVEAGDKPEETSVPPLSPQEDEAVLDHSPTASPAAAGRLSKKRKLRQDEDTEETRFMADDPEIVASTAHEDRRHIAHSSPPQTPRKMVQMGHNRKPNHASPSELTEKPKPIQDEEQGEATVQSNDPTAQEDEKVVTESSPPLGHHGTSNGAESSNDADLSATERPTKKRKLVHSKAGSSRHHSHSPSPAAQMHEEEDNTIVIQTSLRAPTTTEVYGSSTPVFPTTVSPWTLPRPQTGEKATRRRRSPAEGASTPSRRRSSSRRNATQKPVAIFSNTNIQEDKRIMTSFASLGARVTSSISDATVLVVGARPLKKTGKLIMAVALGLDVVTEQWITESVDKGQLVNVRKFLPNDPTREQQWSFNLKQALARGKQGLTCLLAGTTVCFTKQLKTDLGSLDRELSQIATILGAEAVKHRLPALKDKDKHDENELLIIGVPDDPQGAHVGRLGHKLYNKDILTMGALRGQIEREFSEFILEVPVKAEDED